MVTTARATWLTGEEYAEADRREHGDREVEAVEACHRRHVELTGSTRVITAYDVATSSRKSVSVTLIASTARSPGFDDRSTERTWTADTATSIRRPRARVSHRGTSAMRSSGRRVACSVAATGY